MSITKTQVFPSPVRIGRDVYFQIVNVTLTAESYPTNGFAFDWSAYVRNVHSVLPLQAGGYTFEGVTATKKIKAFTPAPAEVSHTHSNTRVEEEAISSKTIQRIYHSGVTGTINVGNVVRGGTSNATGKVNLVTSTYLDLEIDETGLDAVYDLNVEAVNDYNAHCGNAVAHIAADVVNNGAALPTARTWAAVYVSLNALKAKYNAHDAESGTYHGAAGAAHQTAAADATTPGSAATLANELKADINAHNGEGGTLYALTLELQTDILAHMANACHMAPDTTNNDFTQLSAQTLAAIMTTLNSLKAKFNSHDGESGTFHCAAGTASQVATADATDYTTALALANAIKAAYETHRALLTGVWTLITELRADIIAHMAMGAGTHTTADVVNNGLIAVTSTFASFMAWANDAKAKLNAHDVETGTYHLAAGTAHQVAAADATDWATLKALVNDIKAKFNAHCADDDCHDAVDATNTTAAADAADEAHLFPDLVNTIAGADSVAALHVTADGTYTISETDAGVTLQSGEVLTDETALGTCTTTTTLIDVWAFANNPTAVDVVLNNANAQQVLISESASLSTGEARIIYDKAQIETLLSDAYTSLKVSYTAVVTVASGDVLASPAAEVANATLLTITSIPVLIFGSN